MGLLRGLYSLLSGLLGSVVGVVSALVRTVVALVLSVVATLLLVVSAVLCVTVVLLPLGIPLGYFALRLLTQSGKVLLPHSGLERKLRKGRDALRSRGAQWRKKLPR